MFRIRRSWTLPAAVVMAVALSGLFASDALADGKKGKNGHRGHGHGHGRPDRVIVVERPAVTWNAGFSWSSLASYGCDASNRVMYADEPYFYHAGLGMYVGGARINVEFGNAPAYGWGYWDPHRGMWIDDLRAYSTWCKRNHVRPMVRVVRFEDRCSGWRG